MKTTNLILAALALTVSGSAFAAATGDQMETTFTCRQPGIADGGYTVQIRAGGLWFHTSATVGEDSIAGNNDIQSFIVKQEARMGGSSFVDTETNGKLFRLKMALAFPRNGNINLASHLEADTKAGRISVDLLCSPVNSAKSLGLDE